MSFFNIKTIIAWLLLSSAAISFSVNAEGRPTDKDEEGLYVNPSCNSVNVIQEVLRMRDSVSTGQTASNNKWNLELYQNKKGEWSLLGLKKKPESKYEEACILAVGARDYKVKKWYGIYFAK